MHAQPEAARGRLTPAALTLPSLIEGGVTACLATIFTEAVPDPHAPGAETGAFAYPEHHAQAARIAGLRQLKLYHAWRDAGLIELIPSPGRPTPNSPATAGTAPLRVGLLMEGADPIADPADLQFWADSGVIAIGLTWALGTRYAGGNSRGAGLSALGRELVAAMDALGILHDVSHLSDRALDDLFDATNRPVIASHSNCRALVPGGGSRHLTDHAIAEIGRRGGVVGINLFSKFLDGSDAPARAPVARVADHADRVAHIMGHRLGVGLGSDMDGGFPASRLPQTIDRPAHLQRILDELTRRGWADADVRAFAWDNWDRVLR